MGNAKKLSADIIISIGVFCILFAFIFNTSSIPKDAKGYPVFLIVCSLILNLLYFIKSIRDYNKGEYKNFEGSLSTLFKVILPYIVMIGLYIFLIEKIGYIISTVLFMVVSQGFLKVKNKVALILVPIITTGLMYYLFTKFLLVMLPSGTWLFG